MKVFILHAGLLWLLSACHSNNHSTVFQQQVNSLQLNFKKPCQPAVNRLTDSIQTSRTKQWYAIVERKSNESDE